MRFTGVETIWSSYFVKSNEIRGQIVGESLKEIALRFKREKASC